MSPANNTSATPDHVNTIPTNSDSVVIWNHFRYRYYFISNFRYNFVRSLSHHCRNCYINIVNEGFSLIYWCQAMRDIVSVWRRRQSCRVWRRAVSHWRQFTTMSTILYATRFNTLTAQLLQLAREFMFKPDNSYSRSTALWDCPIQKQLSKQMSILLCLDRLCVLYAFLCFFVLLLQY